MSSDSATDRPAAGIDFTQTELFRHGFPHELFATLRRERPVSWCAFPPDFPGVADPGFWLLTRYEDVQRANRDTELFSAIDGPSLSHQPALRGNMLVSMDGAPHTRQRKLISAGFTPRMVGRLEEQARRWAVQIIETARERGTCNFVQDVAYQLPMHMIADIVGIPLEDRAHLFQITNDFLQSSDPANSFTEEQAMGFQLQMFQYGQQLAERKRKDPQDDVWSLICTAEVESDGGEKTRLSQIELDFFFLLLTVAGSETTRNAIALGAYELTRHPDQLARLRRDPAALKPAIEEILRWTSPVSHFARRATRDTEIRGQRIAEGERITLWYPSANRDEEVFADAFRFDTQRTPNHHIAFGGGGPHHCLGANLARREMTIFFEELFARTREIEFLAPPRFSALGILNPIALAPAELPVRIA